MDGESQFKFSSIATLQFSHIITSSVINIKISKQHYSKLYSKRTLMTLAGADEVNQICNLPLSSTRICHVSDPEVMHRHANLL